MQQRTVISHSRCARGPAIDVRRKSTSSDPIHPAVPVSAVEYADDLEVRLAGPKNGAPVAYA